jgi:ABC-type nitrate/sulfonate/bicarbonate transport system substrate-binding protein
VMIARKGLPTDVESLADNSWGITAFGANNEVTARAVAAAYGLDPDELNLTAVGPPSSYQPAIKSGKVDVVLAGEPGAENLIASGDGVEVLSLFDPAVVDQVYGGTYATSSLQSTSDFIADNGDLTKALVAAQIQALQWIQDNKADPAAIAAALPEEMRTDTIEAVIKRILPGLSKDGMVQVDALENTVTATKAAGLLDDSVEFDFDDIADNSNRP